MPINNAGHIFRVMDVDDLKEYYTDMFNLRHGQLTRIPFFAGSVISTAAILLPSIFILPFVFHVKQVFPVDSTTSLLDPSTYLHLDPAWYVVLGIILLINLSGFLRRLNDINLSKWFGLLYLIPGLGFVLSLLVGLLPTGFGDQF